MPVAKKGEKITDPLILERLAKAREKALETRRANAKMKADAKLAQQLDKKKADEEVQSKLKKALASGGTEPVVNTETSQKTSEKPAPEPEEPEEEVQIEYIKAPKSRKSKPKKKKVVIVESETESEEEEVVYKKKSKRTSEESKRTEPAAPPPMEDPIDVLFNKYYGR